MLQTFLHFFILFLNMLLTLLFWAIFIHVLMSWFAGSKSRLGEMLDQIVQPIFAPFRWARIGMMDFSPILALLALNFIHKFVIQFLGQFV